MGYGFYPNIPNNQVGVEINNSTIRFIQPNYSNYSMKIEGMNALNLVNTKVIKHFSNMPQDPQDQDVRNRISKCLQGVNENMLRFNSLSNTLYFWDFSIFNDSYFWANRNNFKYYPNGTWEFYNPKLKSTNYNVNLPTIVFTIQFSDGQHGSAGVWAGFNSSGMCASFGMSNVQPETAALLHHIISIGMHVMFNMMKSLQVIQAYTDRTKPNFGLQISNEFGDIYYPNSSSKLSNTGEYVIAPRNSNIDFNAKTVNNINYSNKKICFSDNVTSTIIVDL